MLECNICGHVISAATEDELVTQLRAHMADEHPDAVLDEAAARDLVAAEAYEAMDS